MTYTQLAVVGVVAAVAVDLAVVRVGLLRRRAFWVAYAIILPFQLLTNGWLTGREIVVYDPAATLSDGAVRFLGDARIAFAPVEDVLFGFALVLFTLDWWVLWGRRGVQREPVRRHPVWPTARHGDQLPPGVPVASQPTGDRPGHRAGRPDRRGS